MRLFSIVLTLSLVAGAVAAQEAPPPPVKEYNAQAWKDFTSKEGRFSVLLPGTPRLEERSLEGGIAITAHAFVLETDLALYYISYADLPLPPGVTMTAEDRKEALANTREKIISGGGRIITESEISIAGNAGTEILAEKDGIILRARFAPIEGRLYQLIIGARRNTVFSNGKISAKAADRTDLYEQTTAKFFESFKLTK